MNSSLLNKVKTGEPVHLAYIILVNKFFLVACAAVKSVGVSKVW